MRRHDIIVSTTSTLQGYDIQEYLGPISSPVVAGTNIFSDVLAGFTDILGGRSETYQKQLSGIHDESIDLLKNKAKALGADGILGMKIDHDELSGNGKSMLMVTAFGTAVKINRTSKILHSNNENKKQIDAERLDYLLEREKLIDDYNNQKLFLNDSTWNFVIKNQIQEIYPLVLKALHKVCKREYRDEYDSKIIKLSKEYFLNLPEETTKNLLYNSLFDGNVDIFPFLELLIKEDNLLDLGQIIKLLDSDDLELQKKALVLLQYDKNGYDKNDMEILAQIYDKIKSVFTIKAIYKKEKSKFSSKVKEYWLCECGAKNDTGIEYCINSTCHKDMYGFMKSEVKSFEILKILKYKLAVLESELNNRESL